MILLMWVIVLVIIVHADERTFVLFFFVRIFDEVVAGDLFLKCPVCGEENHQKSTFQHTVTHVLVSYILTRVRLKFFAEKRGDGRRFRFHARFRKINFLYLE